MTPSDRAHGFNGLTSLWSQLGWRNTPLHRWFLTEKIPKLGCSLLSFSYHFEMYFSQLITPLAFTMLYQFHLFVYNMWSFFLCETQVCMGFPGGLSLRHIPHAPPPHSNLHSLWGARCCACPQRCRCPASVSQIFSPPPPTNFLPFAWRPSCMRHV